MRDRHPGQVEQTSVRGFYYKRGIDMDAKTQLLTIALLPMVKANAEEVEKAIIDAGYEPVERYWLEGEKLRTTIFASVKKSK